MFSTRSYAILRDGVNPTEAYDAGPRQLKGSGVDFEWMRHCISACKDRHGSSCAHSITSGHIGGFRVIDCSLATPKVIESPSNCEYVALSYVWGNVSDSSFNLHDAPRIIRDSIEVTLRLGYKYLWVDRYVRTCLFIFHLSV